MKQKVVLILLCMSSSYMVSYHQGIVTYRLLMQNIDSFIQTINQSSPKAAVDENSLVFKDYKSIAANASLDCLNTCAQSFPEMYYQDSSGKSEGQDAAVQICAAVYMLLKKFGQIFFDKKEFHMQVMSISQQDLICKYPHVVLVELQIKVMNLLLHLTLYGSLPEQIFANIHLVGMILPGIYERCSKRWSRKLFKNNFDSTGRLINVATILKDHPYKKFFKKITVNRYDLLSCADKFPKNLSPIIPSECKELVINPYNQTLLHIIDCAMNNNFELLLQMNYNQQDIFIQELYSLYNLIQ